MKKKIMWVGVKSLHDTTAVESKIARLLVKAIADANDIEICVLNTFSFTERESYFLRAMVDFDQVRSSFNIDDGNVKFFYINLSTKIYKNLVTTDIESFTCLAANFINKFKPDIIMGLAQNDFAVNAIFAEAKLRNIPTVSLVINDDLEEHAFYHTDLLISPYKSLCDLYSHKYQLKLQQMSTIFDRNDSVIKAKNPKYIVAIDYGNQSDFDFFINLTLKAKAQNLDQVFLLVRQDQSKAVELLANYNRTYNTNYCLDDFTNLEITPIPYDLKELIALSKYLININNTHLHVTNNILEFLANGVPVLSVADEKLNSLIGKAGICVNRVYDDNGLIVNIDDFYNALETLISKYNEYKKSCATQTKAYDLKSITNSVLEILDPLLAQHASLQSQFVRLGSIA